MDRFNIKLLGTNRKGIKMNEKLETIEDNENREKEENMEETIKETQPAKKLPNKMRLSLGMVVGAYLLYLAYGLFENLGNYEGTEKLFFSVFTFVFFAAGGVLVAFTARAFAKGEYDKGDLSE